MAANDAAEGAPLASWTIRRPHIDFILTHTRSSVCLSSARAVAVILCCRQQLYDAKLSFNFSAAAGVVLRLSLAWHSTRAPRVACGCPNRSTLAALVGF